MDKNKPRQKQGLLVSLLAHMALATAPVKGAKIKPKKKCLQCPELHTHNNRWCSSECAEMYRNRMRDSRHEKAQDQQG